jgi:hypothetical protein
MPLPCICPFLALPRVLLTYYQLPLFYVEILVYASFPPIFRSSALSSALHGFSFFP